MMIASRMVPLLLVALAGCASLPKDVERAPSSALTDTGGTRLARALAPAVAANPGLTAIHPLRQARDAFAARVLLARAAERSLDAQYFIWHDDISGGLLSEALWEAAQRGVRVRLLLDDNNTKGLDDDLAALDAHPNIEIRLFNPHANRNWRLAELAVDFARLNRRMHNKSFTVDNQVTIVGGRNVGDEYFGVEGAVAFQDLDVIAAGAVVPEVSAVFDAYWNSASAYPAASLIPAPQDAGATVREAWAKLHERPEAARYLDAVRETSLIRDLLARNVELEWLRARVVSDDPSKVLRPLESIELHMLPRLQEAVGTPARQLDLVSPYFVPTEAGVAALGALAQRGVQVRILTNSLAGTDVPPVHAGYAKYREPLLRAGVHLYELKPSIQQKSGQGSGIAGSSHASLHAKTFAVDRSRIFVGSFNFDPRSARLNTEMGVVLESPALAARLSGALDAMLPGDAYEVRLSPDGRSLEWIEGNVHHSSEPGVGLLRRMWVGFLSILPIEWLL